MSLHRTNDQTHLLTRWRGAASDTLELLDETDRLIQRRCDLRRQRAEIFREIVSAATDYMNRLGVLRVSSPQASGIAAAAALP